MRQIYGNTRAVAADLVLAVHVKHFVGLNVVRRDGLLHLGDAFASQVGLCGGKASEDGPEMEMNDEKPRASVRYKR